MQDLRQSSSTIDVAKWRNDVARTIQACKSVDHRPNKSLRSHQPSARAILGEISANPGRYNLRRHPQAPPCYNHARKRKHSMDDDEYTPPVDRGGKPPQGRGRPRKNAGQQTDLIQRVPLNDTSTASSKQSTMAPSSGKSSDRSRSQLKTLKTFGQPKTTANIDLPYLGSCEPRVEHPTLEAALAKYGPLPSWAAKLFTALNKNPKGFIPETLKVEYLQNPTLLCNPDCDFLPAGDTPYEPSRLASLKTLVDQIFREAAFDDRMRAIERQWGGTVMSWLCGHLMSWPYPRRFRLLNVEDCPIEPSELHTKMPSGVPLIYSSDAGTPTDDGTEKNSSKKGSDTKGVRKMVDWCLALALDYEDESILEKAFTTVNPNECSLNQSLSYIRRSPLFLDIELKREQPATDPEVELAIWASGALQKKLYHKWSTDLPMPAIAIEGHDWRWYIFVPKKISPKKSRGLVMLGPFDMGSTRSLVGMWQIVYRLNTLINWGTADYSEWFQGQVMGWAQDRLPKLTEWESLLSEW